MLLPTNPKVVEVIAKIRVKLRDVKKGNNVTTRYTDGEIIGFMQNQLSRMLRNRRSAYYGVDNPAQLIHDIVVPTDDTDTATIPIDYQYIGMLINGVAVEAETTQQQGARAGANLALQQDENNG